MLETLLIVFSLSIDALVVSFAYGTNKTKITLFHQCILTGISSSILVSSIFIGGLLQKFLPSQVTLFICITTLTSFGVIRLTEALFKGYLHHKPNAKHSFNVNILGIKLDVEASLPTQHTSPYKYKSLTLKETFALGTALSLDSIAVGIGIGLVNINYLQVLLFSICINLVMLALGNFLGYKVSQKLGLDLGWLSGVILLLLAISKLT